MPPFLALWSPALPLPLPLGPGLLSAALEGTGSWGLRHGWATAQSGVLWLLENKCRSVCCAAEARAGGGGRGGGAKERKSVVKSLGEGGQDKYTQPREQEGWKIPEAEASLHCHALSKGLGEGKREGKCQAWVIFTCCP